ncbi:MAG: ABC transporter substrate-binding protein [Bacteroidia bacterium]
MECFSRTGKFWTDSNFSTAGTLGPYELSHWEAGSHIVLRARDGFWASDSDKPWFSQKADSLIFRFVSDPTSLRLQIRQQVFDIALQIPGAVWMTALKRLITPTLPIMAVSLPFCHLIPGNR